jgi:hypothetical protein
VKAQALLHLDLQYWYVLALVLISADLLMQRKDVFSFNFPRTVFGLQRGLLALSVFRVPRSPWQIRSCLT